MQLITQLAIFNVHYFRWQSNCNNDNNNDIFYVILSRYDKNELTASESKTISMKIFIAFSIPIRVLRVLCMIIFARHALLYKIKPKDREWEMEIVCVCVWVYVCFANCTLHSVRPIYAYFNLYELLFGNNEDY